MRLNSTSTLYILGILLLSMTSCGDEEPEFNIENPATYQFLRNGNPTVSFSGQSTRIAMATELIEAMKDFDTTSEQLLEMYSNQTSTGEDTDPFSDVSLNESTKSVKSKIAASRDFFNTNSVESNQIKSQFTSWIEAQVAEVFPNANELAEEGKAGQIADGSTARFINSKGLEYNQAVNKGLIGSLMVDQMLNNYLSLAVLDEGDNIATNNVSTLVEGENYTNMEHKWDEAYGYLFGASTNRAAPLATLGEDSFLNKYLQRVNDDTDFAGIADNIYQAFKLGRAAIVAEDYATRDKQADIIKEEVSKIIGVRAVYYLQQGKNKLGANDMGSAFHDLSEGYGFVYSLRFTRKAGSNEPYFNQSEVSGFLSTLDQGNGFWSITAESLDQMSIDIASKFDFTVEQAGE